MALDPKGRSTDQFTWALVLAASLLTNKAAKRSISWRTCSFRRDISVVRGSSPRKARSKHPLSISSQKRLLVEKESVIGAPTELRIMLTDLVPPSPRQFWIRRSSPARSLYTNAFGLERETVSIER
jgi:hypothetical protein